MSLLTDEEIAAICAKETGFEIEGYQLTDYAILDFARGIEAAILAKLASAELPEPAGQMLSELQSGFRPYYTEHQMAAWGNTRFAQGAAAQLSVEPVAARVWVGSYEGADHENQYVYSEDGDGEPLYTRRQVND